VRRYPDVRPRNVTATRAEIDALLGAAPPHLRLWLLFCSDLAIRSGTASRLAPRHFDPERRELRFTTKHNARQTLPVTEEIRALILQCDLAQDVPFVRQLWHLKGNRLGKPIKAGCDGIDALRYHFAKLRAQVGITRRITPHDLRRTAAVAMLEYTRDVRDVQALLGHRNLPSTLWYLDHDLRPIKRSTLELLKRPAWRESEEANA
jgi:integrase